MVFLEGSDGEVLFLEGADGFDGGFGGAEVGAVTNLVLHGAGADGDFVLAGLVAGGGVDDEVDVAVLHHVDDVGALLLGEFVEAVDRDAFGFEALEGAAGGLNFEAKVSEVTGDGDGAVFVAVVDGEEDIAFSRKRVEGADLGFGVGHAEVLVGSHHFAGGFHFRSEHDVDAGKASPREDGFFYAEAGWHGFFGEAEVDELFADHDLGGELGEGNADGLGNEGHGAGGAWVDFDDVEFVVFDGELDVHEAADFEFLGESFGSDEDFVFDFVAEGEGRNDAGGVA